MSACRPRAGRAQAARSGPDRCGRATGVQARPRVPGPLCFRLASREHAHTVEREPESPRAREPVAPVPYLLCLPTGACMFLHVPGRTACDARQSRPKLPPCPSSALSKLRGARRLECDPRLPLPSSRQMSGDLAPAPSGGPFGHRGERGGWEGGAIAHGSRRPSPVGIENCTVRTHTRHCRYRHSARRASTALTEHCDGAVTCGPCPGTRASISTLTSRACLLPASRLQVLDYTWTNTPKYKKKGWGRTVVLLVSGLTSWSSVVIVDHSRS